jgi:hypothetical protein
MAARPRRGVRRAYGDPPRLLAARCALLRCRVADGRAAGPAAARLLQRLLGNPRAAPGAIPTPPPSCLWCNAPTRDWPACCAVTLRTSNWSRPSATTPHVSNREGSGHVYVCSGPVRPAGASSGRCAATTTEMLPASWVQAKMEGRVSCGHRLTPCFRWAHAVTAAGTDYQGRGNQMGTWFWLNFPLALLFFGCWAGIPLWLTLTRWDQEIRARHAEIAAQADPAAVVAQPAEVPAAVRQMASLASAQVAIQPEG